MKAFEQGMYDAGQIELLLIDKLNSDDSNERYNAVKHIKNMVIGMKSKKVQFITMGLVPRLLDLMVEEDTGVEFAIEAAVILGSLAKGDIADAKYILDTQAVSVLCKGVCHQDDRLVMACLRSLRTCFMTDLVPSDIIYEDPNVVCHMVQKLAQNSQMAECAANILRRSCKTASDQSMLYEADIIRGLLPWLNHKQSVVLTPILGCISALVCCNEIIAGKMMIAGEYCEQSIKDILIKLISRDQPLDVQLEAATCLTKILRARGSDKKDENLERRILTVFVRMCQKDKSNKIRILAAEGLACLIEDDNDLQEIASISDHLLKNIASYFHPHDDVDQHTVDALKEAAFKVFAALSANHEKIRKQVADTSSSLIHNIHECISQDHNLSLQAASLQCLLSLSRSVQQLRTTFQDVKLWQPVISALKRSTSDDVISVASSVLCNLLLDFSPCKEALVEYGALEVLVALIKRAEAPFRVNGVWGLMNLAYDAEDKLKTKIIEVVRMENILSLLNDYHVDVAVKALGILRNLLTEKEPDIDKLMRNYGSLIITSVQPLVHDDTINDKLKEQVLCLMSNIANGSYSKSILMQEEEMLTKIISYMNHSSEKLQVASVFCITNLVWNSEDGATERQSKMRELGAEKQLQTLITTPNANLFDKVKIALQQFS